MPRSHGLTISSALRRQLEVTVALANERLMEVHHRYVMEFVDHAREQVEPARAIRIYARLHSLRDEDATRLHQQAFVSLGRRNPPKPGRSTAPEPSSGPDTPQSILGIIRKRLRGRVNVELREWVEGHTGRAETELLWSHVENAIQFVELLEPSLSVGEAVELYAAELGVPPSRVETIYYLTLAHRSAISAPGTPVGSGSGGSGSEDPQRPAAATPSRSLRIVSGRRPSRTPQPG
jgi:hypothetical protein